MKINLANIKKAKKLLNKSECVAIPTETVYGLAANAYSDQACKKIYKLKILHFLYMFLCYPMFKKGAVKNITAPSI